ncbi:SDR family NAD(P)-dependent oxidoreductase [Nonomuraea harbinensis]|uniref:SDR family NAD(P)-dependent oxidoreductase n=1 Tax=Nonomuraea harbinensis TaxID=1286938 RepID=A0ABW1C3P0_9ACTN|nr:SDR family oxidoreductase [Nonomuraea harbinensis]
MTTFDDRVALVTGAGSGIGRAMALAFAAAGGRVVVCDIDEDRAARTAAEIHAASGAPSNTGDRSSGKTGAPDATPDNGPNGEAVGGAVAGPNGGPNGGVGEPNGGAVGGPNGGAVGGPNGGGGGGVAVAVAADVGDEGAVAALVESAISAYGRIDALFNNAGIIDDMALPADISPELWDRVLRVNLTGTFLVTRAVLPHMLRAGRGAIVNTASEAGVRGGAAGAAYTASKHGVVGMTRSVAWAYAKDGIRCNAILPGATLTGIADGATFDPTGAARLSPVLALGDQLARPEQMADAALFLASDAASFVNGAIVPVDGGWSAG